MSSTPELLGLWPGFEYKKHQVDGVNWMLDREQKEVCGGLVCDEMGLGKTMEVLGLIKNTPSVRATLLLAPKAVLAQWRAAAQRSKINVCVPAASKMMWDRPQPFFVSSSQTIYITNYEKVLHRPSLMGAVAWDRIVLDEAHRIRNGTSVLTLELMKMAPKIKSRWAVTATPIVNSMADINTLFRFVGYPKERLGTFDRAMLIAKEAILYRSMEEMRPVLKDLPNKPVVDRVALDFATEEEQEFYQGIQGAIVRRWKALEEDGGNSRMKLLLLMRLRQISLHPQVYINAMKKDNRAYKRRDWQGDSTKFVALRRKIESTEKAQRWIVFCQFHDEIDILEAYLGKSPAIGAVFKYDGRTVNKEAVIEETKGELEEGKHQVLLLQLHSGGVGLNLQHFTQIVFLSPWWTAALMDQAVGRAVRIGQKEQVQVTFMFLKEEATLNIDAYMHDAAERKRGLCERLLSVASAGQLAEEDLDDTETVHGGEEEDEVGNLQDDEENPQAVGV